MKITRDDQDLMEIRHDNPFLVLLRNNIRYKESNLPILGKRLSKYIGVGFEERRPSTIEEALSTVKNVVREQMQKYNKE